MVQSLDNTATGTPSFETSSAAFMEGKPPDPVPGFPKVSRTRLQNDLNVEFNSLKSGYDTAKTRRMKLWQEYRFQAYGNEVPGQSSIVDSTIFNTIEWYIPTLIQPFIETEDFLQISPTSADVEHIVTAEVLRELLTVQIRRRNPYYQILYDTIKALLVQGESYLKIVWKKKTEDSPSYPVIKVVPAAQIRYDWTVQNFLESHVVTQEEDMSRSDILKLMDDADGLMKNQFKKMLSTPGRNMKIGRLRDEKQDQPNWVGEDDTKSSNAMSLYTRREHWTQYDMNGDGKAVPILAVFIDDHLVQVVKNPYDFQRPPFVAAQAIRDPLGNPAFGIAEVLSDIQKFRTGILRMTSDNLNAQHNGLYEMDMTNIDDVARLLLENVPMGTRTGIPVRKPGSITPLQPAPIATHAFTAWEIMAEAGENRSGFTRYSQGLDSKSLNQTATGITQILQRSDMRSWEFAQRFAEMCLKPMTRMLISLNQQLLDDASLRLQFGLSAFELKQVQDGQERVSKFKGLSPGQWLTLNKKDIGGVFSVSIDVQVGADKQQRIENLFQYLQFTAPFIGQGVPQEAVSVVAVELAKALDIPKVQAVMRESYIGTAGVTAPSQAFTGQGEGPLRISSGPASALASVAGESGVPSSDLGSLLGGITGNGAATAPTA